ncbi:hypothetical protein CAC42_2164 [Sphaceloma murrayae]|uniref:LysM domain-containing protein n=1 Tax=Sphaceloma murrayae TaxID=2082308 RepID=A0A2K1QIE6_9PEZI|nr:hypothetical protein CAC42_2164 [Sphaceloma murrayae]
MSRTITVHNKSGQSQTFLVHGWNKNQNIGVPAHGKINLNAPDGSSGAIIALHDGVEGEPAEITKKGFAGNDFFDMSYIVGLGGSLTIMQAGDRSTLKGHPTLMQACNATWQKTDQGTRNAIKQWVHLDGSGKVIRVDKPAANPKLEDWVRTFAGGYGYVGVGAWKDDAGHPQDNEQSSAVKGNKDILITYNDGNGDANPDDSAPAPKQGPAGNKYTIKAGDTLFSIGKAHNWTVQRYKQRILATNPIAQDHAIVPSAEELDALRTPNTDASPSITLAATATPKPAPKGPGIDLTNKSAHAETYFFFDNYWNGNGTAGANFDKTLKAVVVQPGKISFVPLPITFKGRAQRGKLIPATWAEFQMRASDDGKAHGDIGVQQGNDGPVVLRSTDGSGASNGFDKVVQAPREALRKGADGKVVIDATVGNWMGGPNRAAIKA